MRFLSPDVGRELRTAFSIMRDDGRDEREDFTPARGCAPNTRFYDSVGRARALLFDMQIINVAVEKHSANCFSFPRRAPVDFEEVGTYVLSTLCSYFIFTLVIFFSDACRCNLALKLLMRSRDGKTIKEIYKLKCFNF